MNVFMLSYGHSQAKKTIFVGVCLYLRHYAKEARRSFGKKSYIVIKKCYIQYGSTGESILPSPVELFVT